MKMIRSRLWQLLLFLWLPRHATASENMGRADAPFDVRLCGKGVGLQLKCFVPENCGTIKPIGQSANLKNTEIMADIENCDVIMAIQPHTERTWRIVMQGKSAVTKHLKLYITLNGQSFTFKCLPEGTNDISGTSEGNQFAVGERYGFYDRTGGEKIMCDFTISKNRGENIIKYLSPPGGTHAEIALEWYTDETIKMNAPSGFVNDLDQAKVEGCELQLTYKDTAAPDEEYKRFNMDKPVITCPDGYTMRYKAVGTTDVFATAMEMKCFIDGGATFLIDGQQRNSEYNVHCARKKCAQCKLGEDLCVRSATKECPEVPKLDGFDACAELKCAAKFIINGVVEQDTAMAPKCESGTKWTAKGQAITSIECGEKVPCGKPEIDVIVVDSERMLMTQESVTCRDNRNMSYNSSDQQTVHLVDVTCNLKDGQWYERPVANPKQPQLYKKEHKLLCTGDDDDAVPPVVAAPKTGGSALIYVGAALGALALIAIAAVLIFCFCCKRNKKEEKTQSSKKKSKKSSKSGKSGGSGKSKESRTTTNAPSSSGAPGPASGDQSQKKSGRDEREKVAIGIDQSEAVATGISIDKSAPKTANEIKDEERSNPTERSAIPKTADLKDMQSDAEKKKKTGMATAMPESSKADEEEGEGEGKGQTRVVQTAMQKKGGTRTRNLDGTQAGQTTMNPDGTQAGQSTLNPDGTQAQTMMKKRTRKGTFMETAMGDPTRGPDGTQQPSENGPVDDEGHTQIPTNGTADTQAATVAARLQKQKGRRTQATQQGGEEEGEVQWNTAIEKTEDFDGATGIPRNATRMGTTQDQTRVRTTQDQTRVRTTQDGGRTRTRMMTAAGAEDESAMLDPAPDDMKTCREPEQESDGMNTAVGKAKDKEEAKKVKSKKQRETLKPRVIELNDKEKKIKAGAKRNRNDYPTMRDVESDWDSDKDKVSRETPKKKKTLEEKKKKKSKKQEEQEKKESKRKEKEKRKSGDKKEKDRKRAKSPAKGLGEFNEMTAIDDGPTGNFYTARSDMGRDGTQNLTPYDPTQPMTTRADPTQRTRAKTRTVLTTAFDPTETHAAPTAADPTQAMTAQDRTQGATTAPDRTQGGFTTMADGTQASGATTVADFTQAHTGADPTQAGTTAYDGTQVQTTIGDATTQGGTRTRVTGRSRTKGGVSRTQNQTRTRADFTQAGTTQADFTQGGQTTIADQTQAHTGADPTQVSDDPTQAPHISADGSLEPVIFDDTQHQTGTINDPTQMHSAETQEGRTKRSRTKTALTARSGTRPGTTQTRTRADFTQDATRMADGTQGGQTTIADQTQVHTAQDPTQAVTTVGDGTQMGTRTKTRTRQGGTQTATAGDGTQTQTRGDRTQTQTRGDRTQTQTRGERTQTQTRDPTRARDPTQTETRGDETQGQTDAPDGTQVPSKTKTRKTTGKDFTQTATAGDQTQTATRAHGTQTQTAVDPTHQTMTAVDPTRTMTAVDPTRTMTAVDRTRTETKEKTRKSKTQGRTQAATTALDRTGTMTAVDPTNLTTAKDRTQTQTAVDGTGTMTAVDPTHQTMTAVDPTHQTMTAVDPTRTMTAVDPTRAMTAVDRTRTETKEKRSKSKTQGRTQAATTALDRTGTVTAVDPTHMTTAKDGTQTATAVDGTGTVTAVDRTGTMTAVDPTNTMTAVDQTHLTQTAVDPTGTVTAVDPTRDRTRSATKMATRTQTATAAEQTQTNLERTKTKTAKDRTQTQTNADETQGHGATTLGQEQTQAVTRQSTAKDKTQTATRDRTREGRTQTALTSANKTQTTAKDHTQMTGHETTQGPTSKDPTQTHNDQ